MRISDWSSDVCSSDLPVNGIVGYENRARVEIYGAEASGYWNFAENWRTWASFAWAVGRDTEEEEYINSVPALRGILGLGYATVQWGADASVTAAAARADVSNDGFKAPDYTVAALKIGRASSRERVCQSVEI